MKDRCPSGKREGSCNRLFAVVPDKHLADNPVDGSGKFELVVLKLLEVWRSNRVPVSRSLGIFWFEYAIEARLRRNGSLR